MKKNRTWLRSKTVSRNGAGRLGSKVCKHELQFSSSEKRSFFSASLGLAIRRRLLGHAILPNLNRGPSQLAATQWSSRMMKRIQKRTLVRWLVVRRVKLCRISHVKNCIEIYIITILHGRNMRREHLKHYDTKTCMPQWGFCTRINSNTPPRQNVSLSVSKIFIWTRLQKACVLRTPSKRLFSLIQTAFAKPIQSSQCYYASHALTLSANNTLAR